MNIFVAHASAFDYENKLYAPLRAFGDELGHEITLPHERGHQWDSREVIKGCDAFILDASVPSTGAGIEAGWASAAGVPILVVHERGSRPSAVVEFIASEVIEYEGTEDLVAKLGQALAGLR